MPPSTRRRKRQAGNAMLEFALGATVLVSVFTGTFEFGYLFYVYNNVENAVNNGAKYAAMRTYEVNSTSASSCFKTAVQDMVAYGDPTGNTTNPVAPGLTPSKVTVTVQPFVNGVPSQMTVGVTGYTIDAVVARITLTNKPQATYPFIGRYAPGETCTQ